MIRFLRYSPVGLLFLVVGCFNANPADKLGSMPPDTGFILRDSNGQAGKHKYTVFVPRDYSSSKKYPAIVFLHGIGESGSDGKKCTTVGLGPAIAKRNGEFPFIVVFPQTGWDWTSETSDHIMTDALADAEKHYSIDTDRVFLTGMSSGGRGTWVLGARHRDQFAALIPMAGYAAYDEVPQLRNMPIWALHNSGDFIVPVGGTREMVKRIKAEGNPNVHYDEFKASGHNCWDEAYDKGELFAWMQQQHASSHAGSAVISRGR
jgi:predicted peptidase